MKQTRYIHYGSEHFDKDRFVAIKNSKHMCIKPSPDTGMWGSPIESRNGWYQWSVGNDFRTYKLNTSFEFVLKPGSNVLCIFNDDDLERIKKSDLLNDRVADSWLQKETTCIDFEKCLERGIDAIEVHVNSEMIYFELYGWDCDSILILNPDCVEEV